MDHREVDSQKRERVIAALAARTDHSVEEIRAVFAREYARLEASAKVRTHLDVLVASNVRAILRRAAATRNRAAQSLDPLSH